MGFVALRRGNHPGLGIDPMFSALAGRFLTTEPQGKPSLHVCKPCVSACMHACWVASLVSDFEMLWTVTCQALLSTGCSRQESWSGLPCPPPRELPDPGIKPTSPAPPALQVDPLPLSHWRSPLCVSTSLQSRLSLEGRDLVCSAQHITGAFNGSLLKSSASCTGRAAPEAAKLWKRRPSWSSVFPPSHQHFSASAFFF